MFLLFVLCKLVLTVLELAIPVLMAEFISFMESETPPEYMTTAWAIRVGLSLVAIKVFKHTLWENLCYKMVLTGHTAHMSLKTILFAKTFRMSNATNKDYSSGEIMNLIHRDAGRVWSFVWDLSTIIETPIEMMVSAYFLWTNLGWCSFTGLGLYAALWHINKYKSKLHRKTWRVVDRKRDKRMLQTSEAFHNAKMLKLYGWEQKFQANVTDLYEEEQKMQREQENFSRMVDFLPNFINRVLPLIVFCSYVYFGGKITIAKLVICETMIRRFNGNIGHIIHHYNDWEHLQTSLEKVHTFYAAYEMQKGVVARTKDADAETAVKIKGHFSRGINLEDDAEEKKEEDEASKGYFARFKKWISGKIYTQ